MKIDSQTGLITWSPTSNNIGYVDVNLSVSDTKGAIERQTYRLAIVDKLNRNHQPRITTIPISIAEIDKEYKYDVNATDADGDSLTYRLDSNPSGMKIDSQTGLITWSPTSNNIGYVDVNLSVSDTKGAIERQTYRLAVVSKIDESLDINNSVKAEAGYDKYIDLNQTVTLNGTHSYSIGGNIVSYKWQEDNNTISTSGSFSYKGVSVGKHTINLTVVDNNGLTDKDEVIVAVFGSSEDDFKVDAGSDQNITIQDSVTLDGSKTYSLRYKIIKYEWRENNIVYGTSPVVWLQRLPLGVHTITLTATDITGTSKSDDVVIRVSNGTKLIADAGKDKYIELGDRVTFDATNSFDPNGKIVSYLWSEGDTTLSTKAIFEKSDFTLGTHLVTLKVVDNDGNEANDTVRVIVKPVNDTTPPIAKIKAPSIDSTIKLKTDIVGTASDKHIKNYRILISPVGQNKFIEIAKSDSSVSDGVLATLDATTLKNGIYDVSLEVTDLSGNSSHDFTRVKIEGKAKVGNFSFTVKDFDIKVGGIPVQVNRTYSTLQRFRKFDFTYGWSIDYQSVKTQENINPGKEWRAVPKYIFGSIVEYCYRPNRQHIVNVALPDGSSESFEYKFENECGKQKGSTYDAPKLYALNGSTAKLEASDPSVSDTIYMNDNGELMDPQSNEIYNPNRYRLTLANGMVYELEQNRGILSVKNLRGDTLTYSHDGILSSRGESLSFERDSKDRITKITDLAGKSVQYHYNDNDDLDYVIDQMGYKTEYRYLAGHLMSEYYDPSGKRLTKNFYDKAGRLIKSIDADGNVVEYTHDIDGREEIVKDKLDRTHLYVYDEQGNVISQTNPLGETTTHTYDSKGRELTVTNPLGESTTNEYDAKGNLISTTDALGNSESTTYNDKNSPTSISDKNGNTLNIVYNDYNSPRSITTPSGAKTTYYYDKYGNKIKSINENNQTTTYEYDEHYITLIGGVSSKGNLLKETRPNGVVIEHSYDDSNNLLSTTTTYPNGDKTTTSNRYDAFNSIISTTDEHGLTTTYEYDARGNKISQTDSQNRVTKYSYNSQNRLIKTEYPDGTTESKTYDAMGNLISETNQEGETTSYEYDGADRLIKTTYPDGSTTQTKYDEAGRVVKTVDQRGNETSFEYDAVGNKIKTTDALGGETKYSYDANGNLLSVTDALNHTTSYEYNALNQRVKTIYPDGTTTKPKMNKSGLPISKTNEAGYTTTFAYDTSSIVPRLNRVTLPNQATTNYTYNPQGQKLSQSDALNHTITYSYKPTGELKSETLPLGQSKTYSYDKEGKVTKITDFANRAQKFIYNSYNRLVKIEYSDGNSVTYDYTPSGRVKTITDSSGTIEKAYDSLGRLKSQTNPSGETIEYEYDKAGNIVKIQTPTKTITKTYDALNRLKSVTDNKGTTNYIYDAIGRVTKVEYPNGVSTEYSYDSRNHITNITHKTSTNKTLQSFTYSYDRVGNRIKVVEKSGKTIEYSYNKVNQLIKELITNDPNGNNSTTTFTYDKAGNLVSKSVDGVVTTYTYNANNQLTQKDNTNYTYDKAGNLISDSTNSYEYDSKNRLVKVITPTQTVEYIYDANDNRIAKTTSSGTTTYLIDSNTPYAQVITESKENGTKIEYTYGLDLISNQSQYYLSDALGSTRALVDSNQKLTDSYSYTPYGKLANHIGSSDNSFLFTGEQRESETDNYYLRARYYSPSMARFLSRDTYDGNPANPLSQNHYLYASGNPLTYVDPSGHLSMPEEVTVIQYLGIVAQRAMSASGRILLGLVQRLPAIARGGVRGLAREAEHEIARRQASLAEMEAIYIIARLYARFGDHEEPDKIPIQVYGSGYLPEHQDHIFRSILGFGSNGSPTPFLLSRNTGERDDDFLDCALPTAEGKCRDEYPYNSTYQGGEKNYRAGKVSKKGVWRWISTHTQNNK